MDKYRKSERIGKMKIKKLINSFKKIKNPVKSLTGQIKLNLNAVELVRQSREDFK